METKVTKLKKSKTQAKIQKAENKLAQKQYNHTWTDIDLTENLETNNSDSTKELQAKDEGIRPVVFIKVIESESNFEFVRQAYREKIVQHCSGDMKFLGEKDSKKAPKMPSKSELKAYAKEIEQEIFRVKNEGNKEQTKEYTMQLRSLIYNLQDPENTELRKKLLLKVLNPNEIANMKEIDFLAPKKKRDRVDKNLLFFRAWEKEVESIPEKIEQIDSGTDWEEEEVPEAVQIYDLQILKSINTFLNDAMIDKMEKRLSEIPAPKIRDKLIRNLQQTFD